MFNMVVLLFAIAVISGIQIVCSTIRPTETVERIVGGSQTSIQNYQFAAVILIGNNQMIFRQQCGGSVLNIRSILTAAQCINPNTLERFRVRLGSTFANSGGMVYFLTEAIVHPNYNLNSMFDSDIALLHTSTPIVYIPNLVERGTIAGSRYVVPDDDVLVAIGWGLTSNTGGTPSEQLRHVEIRKVNHDICRQRWFGLVTDNMMCAGLLDIGGRGQCGTDAGSPLLHRDIIVGIASFTDGTNCVSGLHPNVNVRVSRFTDWILANA